MSRFRLGIRLVKKVATITFMTRTVKNVVKNTVKNAVKNADAAMTTGTTLVATTMTTTMKILTSFGCAINLAKTL